MDHYTVLRMRAWKGVPTERSTMWFMVEYADGDVMWQEWNKGLDLCEAFDVYVKAQRPLFLLRYPAKAAAKYRAYLNQQEISNVGLGTTVYVDLRRWGEAWYDQLTLPDAYTTVHVVLCVYKAWVGRNRRKIQITCQLFNEAFAMDGYEVYCYGSEQVLTGEMTLVTAALVQQHPKILSDDEVVQERLLARL